MQEYMNTGNIEAKITGLQISVITESKMREILKLCMNAESGN
jgi:hypothetical protein